MSKQYDNLYGQIIDFDNLLAAYHRSRQGKKKTKSKSKQPKTVI